MPRARSCALARPITTPALAALLMVIAAAPAAAQVEPYPPDCSTPRRAVQTWLDNQLAGATHDAVRCFAWSEARVDPTEWDDRSAQMLQILDTRGHIVVYEDIPDSRTLEEGDRAHLFPDRGKSPELYLVKDGERWVFSRESIRAIPAIYADLFPFDVDAFLGNLPAWATTPVLFGVAWWQYIGLLLLIFLGMVARALVAWLVRSQSRRVLKRRGEDADVSVLDKAAKPIGTIVMAGVVWYLLPALRFGVQANNVMLVALRVVAAASAVLVTYRLVDVVSDVLQRRASKTDTRLDDQLVPLLRKSAKTIVAVLGVIFVLQNLEVDVASLLAGVTVGGLAFSFAARDLVANLFGSVAIFAEGPFQIGDWIVVDGKQEGTVEEIGMRSTKIRTFYNSVKYIPNSTIANAVIDNYSQRKKRRTHITLGIGYDSTPQQVEAFTDGVRAILQANPTVEKSAFEVHFKGFGESALEIMVYFFLDTTVWSEELRARHNLYLEFMRLAQRVGVSFAFPTRTLHVASMASPKEPPAAAAPDEATLASAVEGFGPDGAHSTAGGLRLTHGYFAVTPKDRGATEDDG